MARASGQWDSQAALHDPCGHWQLVSHPHEAESPLPSIQSRESASPSFPGSRPTCCPEPQLLGTWPASATQDASTQGIAAVKAARPWFLYVLDAAAHHLTPRPGDSLLPSSCSNLFTKPQVPPKISILGVVAPKWHLLK